MTAFAPLLEVDGLSTVFSVRDGEIRPVNGIDLTVRAGETVARVLATRGVDLASIA